jgi:hypothetical protein
MKKKITPTIIAVIVVSVIIFTVSCNLFKELPNELPTTFISSGPEAMIYTTTATFTWSGSDPENAGKLTFSYNLDETGWSEFADITTVTFSNLVIGSHIFKVKAKDADGNEEANPVERIFEVLKKLDEIPPDTTIDSGPTGSIKPGETVTFTFSGQDNETTASELLFAFKLNDEAWSSPSQKDMVFAGENKAVFKDMQKGKYTFYVKAIDSSGNEDPSPASWKFEVSQIENKAPETYIDSAPTKIKENETATFKFSGSDDHTSKYELEFAYSFNGESWTNFKKGGSASFSNLKEGTYTFAVKARDEAGLEDPTPAQRSFEVEKEPVTPTDFFKVKMDSTSISVPVTTEATFTGIVTNLTSGKITVNFKSSGVWTAVLCNESSCIGPEGDLYLDPNQKYKILIHVTPPSAGTNTNTFVFTYSSQSETVKITTTGT